MNDSHKIPAEWTDDCSGKKDFDAELVYVSTRYWPRGGGFMFFDGSKFEGNKDRPEIKPSAACSFILRRGTKEVVLIRKEFEGESFEEVSALVEVWAQRQYERIITAMTLEFGALSPPEAK